MKKTQFANTAQMYVVAMPRLNDVFRLQLYLELGYHTEESFIDKASWDDTEQRSVTLVCLDFQGLFCQIIVQHYRKYPLMIEAGKEKGNTCRSPYA